MKGRISGLIVGLFLSVPAFSQEKFSGIESNLSNIFRLSDAKTRSISPENFNGAKGKGGMATTGTGANAARDLGQGWKISPSVVIKSKTTFTIAEIDGSGSIQHIWMTPTGVWRNSIFVFIGMMNQHLLWKRLWEIFSAVDGTNTAICSPLLFV